MPPRLPSSRCQPQQLLNYLEASAPSSSPLTSSSPLASHTHRIASSTTQCSRTFSTTPARPATRLRRQFREWLDKKGPIFREPPAEGGTNYISKSQASFVSDFNVVEADMPFPNNPLFRSEPVLSDEARERIWEAVMKHGMPLKAVSAQFSVDMRRVAAVVRMKEIEKKWERENKPMAEPYARAVMSMLPRHNLDPAESKFEPINDIHVHSYTMQQLFLPTSESREFTRADAAKAFGDHILPPDAKMRIPELVQMEKNIAEGMDYVQAKRVFVKQAAESEQAFAAKQKARQQAQEDRRVRVNSGRFEYRFEKINAEDVGPTGRSRRGVGWRYGVPFYDRRRGEIKIPTKVE